MRATQRNNVHVKGSGHRTIVFAHGYGCDQTMWQSVAPAFEHDFRVVLFDHVGAGGSDFSAFDRIRHSSLQGYAQDLLEVFAELNLTEVRFVGHSVSGMIGALAAIQHPELFESQVMISSSPRYVNDGEYFGGFEQDDVDELLELLASNHVGWSMSMAPVIMGNADRPELAAELASSFCRADPEIAYHFASLIFLSDNRSQLKNIRTRTLVMQTANDPIVPESVGRYLAASIPASNYALLNATGHCPHMSAPAEVIEAIRKFL